MDRFFHYYRLSFHVCERHWS